MKSGRLLSDYPTYADSLVKNSRECSLTVILNKLIYCFFLLQNSGLTCATDKRDCFCTFVTDTWVTVDLRTAYNIKEVVVFGPMEGAATYFNGVKFHVSNY